MGPCYYAFDCIPAVDGRLRVLEVHGGVGTGLESLEAAYGGRAGARARLHPFLQRLGDLAGGRRVLFLHDPFAAGPIYPDDFFNLVQRFAPFSPITDWVSELQNQGDRARPPDSEHLQRLLEPLGARLRLKLGDASVARVQDQDGRPMVLLSGFRNRPRRRPTSVILAPEDLGAVVYSGPSDRFPDDFRHQGWFSMVNPPLLDRLLENRWLAPLLLRGTDSERLVPRWVPVGMGMRTADEVVGFGGGLQVPGGFPLAVLRPSHPAAGNGLRFLDRTALRALAARQPARRIPFRLAEELIAPRVSHSYEEISGYRGKLLDNLLRTTGAEVHDHGDGTFHYSAPYPFLQNTVALLREFVEDRPVRSRRTGRLHRGYLRVVLFDGKVLSAIYRLDREPDDGTYRDLNRSDTPTLVEAASLEDEEAIQSELGPFVRDLEAGFEREVRSAQDLDRLTQEWVREQAEG